jgi:hypothetical protein
MIGILLRRIYIQKDDKIQKKTDSYGSSRESSEETYSTDSFILDLQPPEQGENNFLLMKPPGVWYFVVATVANLHTFQ